jgi:membrane protein
MRERLALAIAALIATHFVYGRTPWTAQRLTQRLGIPMHAVDVVLDALVGSGLMAETGDDPPAYVPARDLDRLSLADLLAAVRRAGEDKFLNPDALPVSAPTAAVAARIDAAVAGALDAATARDLVAVEPGTDAAQAPPK